MIYSKAPPRVGFFQIATLLKKETSKNPLTWVFKFICGVRVLQLCPYKGRSWFSQDTSKDVCGDQPSA